ncbi:MAG TPA: VanZ family protein [Halomonas sp.]|nr:VanZ family protein [Halomonas sp.]
MAKRRLRRWRERRRLWAWLAIAAMLAVAWGSLTPASELPQHMPWDKASHFVGYGVVAGLIGLAGVRLVGAFWIAVIFGIAIEGLQLAVPGRSGGDPFDVLANTLGAGSAIGLLAGLDRLLAPSVRDPIR